MCTEYRRKHADIQIIWWFAPRSNISNEYPTSLRRVPPVRFRFLHVLNIVGTAADALSNSALKVRTSRTLSNSNLGQIRDIPVDNGGVGICSHLCRIHFPCRKTHLPSRSRAVYHSGFRYAKRYRYTHSLGCVRRMPRDSLVALNRAAFHCELCL